MLRNSNRKSLIILLLIVFLAYISTPVFAQDDTATLGVFEVYSVSPGGMVQIPVSIKNVDGLYGVDLTLSFDPKALQVQDADTSTLGIQIGLGSFLDPGLVLYNTVDNVKGILHFTMSQYNPSVAKSGDGILILVNFQGVVQGESALTFSNIQLSNREGVAIAVQPVDSRVNVISNAPTQAATIPIAKATGMILIQTATPTQTSVPIENVVKSSTTSMPGTQQGNSIQAEASASDTGSASYFLVEQWWVVLILLAVVVAAGIFFFLINK